MAITPQQAAAKGKGWVDKNNPNYGKAGFVGAEDEDDYVAPAPPAPAAAPTTIAAPNLGPQVYNPTTGTAGHDPSVPMPAPGTPNPNPGGGIIGAPPVGAGPMMAPPVTGGGTMAAPPPGLGPQVFDPKTGAAGHVPDPNQPIDNGGEGIPIDPGTMGGPGPILDGPGMFNPNQPEPAGAPPSPDGGVVGLPPTFRDGPMLNPNQPEPSPYKDALMKFLADAGTPASLDDPTLKGQADAFSNAQTRARERARADMAERAAQDGGGGVDSGAFEGGLSSLQQAQGEAEGSFNAGLLGDANNQKLQQMQSALSMMGADKNSEEGRALQAKIAETQAAISREGLKQNADQFGGTMGLEQARLRQQGDQFGGTMGLERARLAEQARQFGGTMGLEQARLKQQGDQFGTSTGLENRRLDMQGGQFGASLAEQRRQADQDAELRRLGITTQGGQFDKSLAEQRRQADQDAALRGRGIDSQSDLGNRDLSLRDKLGTGGLNAEILRLLMQNDQFNKGEAGTNGRFSAGLNQDAILRMLGML